MRALLVNALTNTHVGSEATENGVWPPYLSTVLLGHIDEREMKVYGQSSLNGRHQSCRNRVLPIIPLAHTTKAQPSQSPHRARAEIIQVRCANIPPQGGWRSGESHNIRNDAKEPHQPEDVASGLTIPLR
jgi:hypothetical protein